VIAWKPNQRHGETEGETDNDFICKITDHFPGSIHSIGNKISSLL
jgi:hypothetical protein